MLIQQRRVRNLDRHLGFLQPEQPVVIALTDLGRHRDTLARAGLPGVLQDGDAILPTPSGPVSRFNAEGRPIIHRDRPKETAYRQVEWTWKEFRGRNDFQEVSGIRDVPYQRYPRTLEPPPAVELQVAQAATDVQAVITPSRAWTDGNKAALRHQVNLLLELFGECSVLTEDLEPLMIAPTRRLNWKLLPAGASPADLREQLTPTLRSMGPRIRPVAEHRLRELESYEPVTVAVGQGGFRGYIVFGFSDGRPYVLENLRWGNATYVLGDDWEEISRLTKSQILRQDLHLERLVHTQGWEKQLARLLRPRRAA